MFLKACFQITPLTLRISDSHSVLFNYMTFKQLLYIFLHGLQSIFTHCLLILSLIKSLYIAKELSPF